MGHWSTLGKPLPVAARRPATEQLAAAVAGRRGSRG